MRIRLFLLVAAVALLLVALGPATLLTAPVSAAGPQAVHAFHPVNANYWNIKAAIDAKSPRGGASTTVANAPTPFVSFNGQSPNDGTPSDNNGGIGPDRYIETINMMTGVYDRNGNLLSQNDEATWSGFSCAYGDPVVMYSAADNRWYAVMLCISGANYTLIYGWSKTGTPSANHADWCFYNSNFGGRYGSNLPDYPKLGDMQGGLLIGVNVFRFGLLYAGSDVAWVQKPPTGNLSNCTFSPAVGTFQNLKNKDGSQAATPNPMKQVDQFPYGVVVANEDPGGGTSTHLTGYKISLVGGKPTISAPKDLVVPAYAYPPSAPQKGTSDTLDTLDARLMSGWMAKDPNHGDAVAVWTGHTVKASGGGFGSEFRWYEFSGTGALYQSGVVQNASRYVFMGAISPDRNAVAGKFGDKWLATVNTSSSNMYTTVSAASGGGLFDIHQATAPDTDYSCSPCRWGDYSGASPDPASTTQGQVWGTGMFSMANGANNPGWGTWNFGAVP
jgi:hypothetical protein